MFPLIYISYGDAEADSDAGVPIPSRGTCRALVMHGEPGVGKTALL